MGGQQTVVKPLYHRHRENDKAIFVGLKRPSQQVRHVPNHGGFFLDIGTHNGKFLVCHSCSLLFASLVFAF
jgi:hypothetical protein